MLKRAGLFILLGAALVMTGAASCHKNVVEDPSEFALTAGQATAVLGADCQNELKIGWTNCAMRRTDPFPNLRLYLMNPGEYAVGDCRGALYKQGAVDQAGEVFLDMAPLASQALQLGFCLIKIEVIERYPDPRDGALQRAMPLAGGYFLEVLSDEYLPTPSDEVVSWCYVVKGTNKGRRKMERCK